MRKQHLGGVNSIAFLLGFSTLFPYPSYPMGNYFGLQIGHAIGLMAIILSFEEILAQRSLIIISTLLVMLTLPALIIDSSNSANLNTSLNLVTALISVLAVGGMDSNAYRKLLKGVFLAIIVQAIVGLWQQAEYMGEQFPLLGIYVNPSFAPLDYGTTSWEVYARYTKRSFGIFPEPSAMFASISTWMVVLGFLILLPSKSDFEKRWVPVARISIFLGGLALIILGRTGGTISLVFGLAPAIFLHIKNGIDSQKLIAKVEILLLIIFAVASVFIAYEFNEDRIFSEFESAGSWDDRAASISYGMTSLFDGEFIEFLFGYGLGMVAPMTSAATGSTSVHSWIASYVMGTGIIGSIGLALIFFYVFTQIYGSNQRVLGFSLYFVWLFNAFFVTGYYQLLSMWLAFGILANWRNYSKHGSSILKS